MIIGKRCKKDIKLDAQKAYLALKNSEISLHHAKIYNMNVTYASNSKEAIDIYANVFGDDIKYLHLKVKQILEIKYN